MTEYQDIRSAVLTKTEWNPLGNCLVSGYRVAVDNYNVVAPRVATCGCVEMAKDLISTIENAKPGSRIYFYPEQVKFFGSKTTGWDWSLVKAAEQGACTGKCSPKSQYALVLEEVKKIVKDPTYISMILSSK